YHGSTVADNAVIEREMPSTALITTEGFRDILEMGRWWRSNLYDLQEDKPQQEQPLIPRRLRFPVTERMDSQGNIITPLNKKEAKILARKIRDLDVKSVAIVFLNSYANSFHEEQMAEIIKKECPGVYVSTSTKIIPKIR